MAWALGTSRVAITGRGSRCDWMVGCCWSVGREVSRRHTIGHVVSGCCVCVCVGGGISPDGIVSVMEPSARLQISIWL